MYIKNNLKKYWKLRRIIDNQNSTKMSKALHIKGNKYGE